MPFDKVNYDNINPWEFLDNLAVNATILGASYQASYRTASELKVAEKCHDIVTYAIRLKKLINEVNM